MPVLLFGKSFWEKIINFQALVDEGVVAEKDLNIFQFVETAKEAWDIIAKANSIWYRTDREERLMSRQKRESYDLWVIGCGSDQLRLFHTKQEDHLQADMEKSRIRVT